MSEVEVVVDASKEFALSTDGAITIDEELGGPVSLDSLESVDSILFGRELDKLHVTTDREKAFEGAWGRSERMAPGGRVAATASGPRPQPNTAKHPFVEGRRKHVAPDPFAAQSARLTAALEATPAHLANERWPVERMARALAFRLEQLGSSLENSTRNLGRLCVALKVGSVEDNKVVAIGTQDLQRIATAWGLVIDRAQVRELFTLRGVSPDAPVQISLFVRRFSESLRSEGGLLLDSCRPRSLTHAPKVDYEGGPGRPNAVELARVASYKEIGGRRRTEFQDAWRQHSSHNQLTAKAMDQLPLARASSNIACLHTRIEQSGVTHTDAIRKLVRSVGHGTSASGESWFAHGTLRLTPQVLARISSGLGVSLSPADMATLMAQFGECSVTEFATRFLNTSFDPKI